MKPLFLVALLFIATGAVGAEPAGEALKIGVLAARPESQVNANWQPLALYLQSVLARRVELRLYDHQELDAAVAQRGVDIVVTSPAHFFLLQQTSGLSAPLATLVTRARGEELSAYGGVIFTRADRRDINTLHDLSEKRIAAVSPVSMGGYQLPLFEMVEAGAPLPSADRVQFMGMPHDKIVEAVMKGQADVGFVRTGVIESLESEGKIKAPQLKIINRQNLSAFPLFSSTRLYPEWPVAVLPQIDKPLASRIAAAVLSLPHGSLGEGTEIHGFEVAANYDGIADLLQRLRLPPFDRPPTITPADIWLRYAPWIIALSALLLLLAIATGGAIMIIRTRRLAEQRLHASEQAFRAVVEHTPDTIVRYDRQCRRIYFNPAMVALSGRCAEELIGMVPDQTSPVPAVKDYMNRVQQVLETGQEIAAEIPYRSASGEIRWGHVRFVPEFGADGKVVSVLAIGRDIHDLKSREQQFRALTENSPDVIVRYDRDCRRIYVNPKFEQTYHLKAGEALGKTPMDLPTVPAKPASEFTRLLRKVLDTGKPLQRDLTWGNNGDTKCLFVRLVPELDPNGNVVGALAIWSDISERKAMEVALRASEREFRTLAENIPDHIIRYDAKGRKIYLNSATARLMGVDAETLVGQTPEETPVETRAMEIDEFARTLHQVLESGEPQELEVKLKHAEAGMQIHSVRFAAERDEKGRVVGALMIGRDITAHKRTEEELDRYRKHLEDLVAIRTRELAQARDAAEAASRAKSVFLANMSHELRTPLNAILGFAELMERDEALPEGQRRNLNTINRSGRHLLSLINDILEISKIEAGRLSAQAEAFEIRELLDTTIESMELRARQAGLELTLQVAEDVPRFISTDLGKLRQILINLISNAIKFTVHGSIDVDVTVGERCAEERVELNISVRDTGIGIAADELEKIFRPFYQTEEGARLGEGTGLGLTISQQYAHLLGGELNATSAVDKGSTFVLRLPVAIAEEAVPLPRPRRVLGLAPGEGSRRVLIVEDKEDNRRLLQQLMTQIGLETCEAANGEEAIAAFEAWHPDLIWMDMRMPVMNGYDATRRIRSLPGGNQVKIAALTASVFREDRSSIIDAGCDDVLAKPIEEAQLFAAIEKLLHIRFRYAENQASSGEMDQPITLSTLPVEMVEQLCRSARILDMEATAAAIKRVWEIDASTAEKLDAMVRAYQYDKIVSLCDRNGRTL